MFTVDVHDYRNHSGASLSHNLDPFSFFFNGTHVSNRAALKQKTSFSIQQVAAVDFTTPSAGGDKQQVERES